MIEKQNKEKGFTLIELLLVMVIISIIIYASIGYIQQKLQQMRIDRTSTQMQQILNAGLAYYVANGSWPTALTDLQGTYLPPSSVKLVNPWGNSYQISSTAQLFYVWTQTTTVTTSSASAAANVIAGTLPLAYTSPTAGTPPPAGTSCTTQNSCYVVASVNIPGQNLNNARAVNFAGLYHHGACVPVPSCPVDANGNTMSPQIFVVPVSVSGLNDTNSGSPANQNVYPISSFTAYATSPATNPNACTGGTQVSCSPINPVAGATYWRVCLQVVTEKGTVSSNTSANWGQYVTLMAITRCAISNEPSGSGFTVYSN
jgi:prepilin-type N-terminal cleavage/methylation domain-containing protein